MGNKGILLLTMCVFLCVAAGGNAAQGPSVNAYEWQKWPILSKMSFVRGWAICGNAAFDSLTMDLNKWNESVAFMNLQEESFKDAGVLLGSVTVGQIVETIDRLYSDPRLKTSDITEIMPLVSGRLIQGWTEKHLDEVIALNLKLGQCEERERKRDNVVQGCSSLRGERNSYLQRLKQK